MELRGFPEDNRSALMRSDRDGCEAAAACGLPVDAVDAQLLRALQEDGRLTNAKLANLVGLAQAAVHDRVRRLVRDGYILGFEALLNPEMLATGLVVFAQVRVECRSAGVGDAFKAAMQARPEILGCYEVAGDFDYVIKTRVPDMRAFRDLLASVVWRLRGVRDVRTYAVLQEVKSTNRVPL